jgi:hypothetical protein
VNRGAAPRAPRAGLALCGALAACGQTGTGHGGGEVGASAEPRASAPAPAAPVARAQRASRSPAAVAWLKGSTHVHTIHSGDSRMPVDDVVRWYSDRGYDFIVVTDHNRVTEVESTGLLVLRGIELTHNPGTCDPPPPEPDGRCRIHVNGIGLTGAVQAADELLDGGSRPATVEWKNNATNARVEMYQAGIDKVRELGGIAQINHPSWHWGVEGELLAELGRRGAVLVEVANMGFARWNFGTPVHPSAEAVWDQALSQGVAIYGVASDDAHHYDEAEIAARNAAGRPVYAAGTGWVMVRAARRPDAIRRALERGDFYASTGVLLDRVERVDRVLEVDVAPGSPGGHDIAFVGQGGTVLQRESGRSARFDLDQAPDGYVRAVVTRDDGARALGQPVMTGGRQSAPSASRPPKAW